MTERVFESTGRLMFGQVREDAAVDLFLLSQIPDLTRVLVVASGGCTALSIVSGGEYFVDALDISLAQICLVELKVLLFKKLGFEAARAACTTDATVAYEQVRSELSVNARRLFDSIRNHLKLGLNGVGWIDRGMRQLTNLFYLTVHSRSKTEYFLSLSNIDEQEKFFREKWCNFQWRLAMRTAFNRRFLSLRHGKTAMELVPQDFSALMSARLKRALTQSPNRLNPYIWQAFLQKYSGAEEGFPVYLQKQNSERMIKNLPNLRSASDDLLPWLAKQESESIGYFGLSNVLELLPKSYSSELVTQIIRCGKPGAIICVRSIFPRRGERTFPDGLPRLLFDEQLSQEAANMDRSLFCNYYEVYRNVPGDAAC